MNIANLVKRPDNATVSSPSTLTVIGEPSSQDEEALTKKKKDQPTAENDVNNCSSPDTNRTAVVIKKPLIGGPSRTMRRRRGSKDKSVDGDPSSQFLRSPGLHSMDRASSDAPGFTHPLRSIDRFSTDERPYNPNFRSVDRSSTDVRSQVMGGTLSRTSTDAMPFFQQAGGRPQSINGSNLKSSQQTNFPPLRVRSAAPAEVGKLRRKSPAVMESMRRRSSVNCDLLAPPQRGPRRGSGDRNLDQKSSALSSLDALRIHLASLEVPNLTKSISSNKPLGRHSEESRSPSMLRQSKDTQPNLNNNSSNVFDDPRSSKAPLPKTPEKAEGERLSSPSRCSVETNLPKKPSSPGSPIILDPIIRNNRGSQSNSAEPESNPSSSVKARRNSGNRTHVARIGAGVRQSSKSVGLRYRSSSRKTGDLEKIHEQHEEGEDEHHDDNDGDHEAFNHSFSGDNGASTHPVLPGDDETLSLVNRRTRQKAVEGLWVALKESGRRNADPQGADQSTDSSNFTFHVSSTASDLTVRALNAHNTLRQSQLGKSVDSSRMFTSQLRSFGAGKLQDFFYSQSVDDLGDDDNDVFNSTHGSLKRSTSRNSTTPTRDACPLPLDVENESFKTSVFQVQLPKFLVEENKDLNISSPIEACESPLEVLESCIKNLFDAVSAPQRLYYSKQYRDFIQSHGNDVSISEFGECRYSQYFAPVFSADKIFKLLDFQSLGKLSQEDFVVFSSMRDHICLEKKLKMEATEQHPLSVVIFHSVQLTSSEITKYKGLFRQMSGGRMALGLEDLRVLLKHTFSRSKDPLLCTFESGLTQISSSALCKIDAYNKNDSIGLLEFVRFVPFFRSLYNALDR